MGRHTMRLAVADGGEVCFAPPVRRHSFPVLAALALAMNAPASAFDEPYKRLGGIWDIDGGPIRYVLAPEGSDDIDGDSELEALRDSFRVWACTPGTKLRFEEGDEPGPRVIDTADGKNTVFWDETGSECLMGPGALGITVGDVNAQRRDAADICFNGLHHTWGIATEIDVQSIAMHEIGHMIGLDHPCDDEDNPETCLPVTEAVMFPSWSGALDRRLLPSDVAGVVALYPAAADDPSGCEGPYRNGEVCGCNDECVEGLVCAPDIEGQLRCARPCSTSDRDCGADATCVLDAPRGGESAVGLCVRVAPPELPAGALCSNGTDCASGTCLAQFTIGSSICQVPCRSSDDCGGGSCFEGVCMGGFASEACPSEGGGCACDGSGRDASSSWSLSVVAVAWALMRRGRGRRS
jgi:hypothetical protein